MNTFIRMKRDDTPCASTAEPPPLRPLANQIGAVNAMCEKLLYRVQQLERREKSYRLTNQALRREVRALKGLLGDPAPKRVRRKSSAPAKGPVSFTDPDLPDFAAAACELNG